RPHVQPGRAGHLDPAGAASPAHQRRVTIEPRRSPMPVASQRSSAATAYVEQEIRSADPVALIASVFEVAVVQVAKARAALAAKDWHGKGIAVDRLTRC